MIHRKRAQSHFNLVLSAKKSGLQVSVGHFFLWLFYRACPSDAAMAQVQNPV